MESFQINDYSVGPVVISDSLMSMEKLDRSSPELWPETIPGMRDFINSHDYTKPNWMNVLDESDQDLLQALYSKTPAELIAEVKRIHDAAYKLGLEEMREMTRGRYLKVLEKSESKTNGVDEASSSLTKDATNAKDSIDNNNTNHSDNVDETDTQC